jgi:hypothetical protein
MQWKKLGPLVLPDEKYYWMESYAGPSFALVENGGVKILVTGRDRNNVSRIGAVECSYADGKFGIAKISDKPLFDIGELGTFDESGVSYPWLVQVKDKVYMFYVGWVNGGKNRFQNFTGLAISTDGMKTFQRVKRVPILDRTDAEPVGSGSCSVFIEDGVWKMYYTAFDDWEEFGQKNKPHYNLKFAYSKDGINWIREKKVIIDYKDSNEHIIGKPMVIKENGIYKLWYSHRGEAYRIGYAESADGLNYTRKDKEVGITVSESGWDSEMQEYAYVFDFRGNRYMIYNGNNFGKTGLGVAVLEN